MHLKRDKFPQGRKDLTHVPTLTIDPYDARDFDDAVSLAKNDKGNWELMVHIADVAHFVPLGSALDDEAKRRATSVYLPDRVIPMLPELISNHLASLQPDKVRLTKTVFMEMNGRRNAAPSRSIQFGHSQRSTAELRTG